MSDIKTDQDIEAEKAKAAYRRVLQGLFATLKNFLLYTPDHPNVTASCETTIAALTEIFQNKFEVTVLHTDGVFVIEDELYIEESLAMLDLVRMLERNRVLSLNFLAGATAAEIKSLIRHLHDDERKPGGDDDKKEFSLDHIQVAFESEKSLGYNMRQNKGERTRRILDFKNDWTERVEKTFAQIYEEQTFQMSAIADPLDGLIDMIHLDPETFGLVVFKPADNIHVEHSIRSMFISVHIGQRLNLDSAALRTLAIAALFHDVGRLLLPEEFQPGYRLSEQDAGILHIHATDGASFLAGVPGLPMTAVRAALEHHIGYDGFGYPKLPGGHKPHFFSEIVGVADFISWATLTEREYYRPASPHKVIRSLLRRAGSQFNPLLVKLVIPMFGLYPAGTKITLSNGRPAVALEANIRNLLRPGIAVQDSSGQWKYSSLTEFPDAESCNFTAGAVKIAGLHADISTLLPIIPDRSQSIT